MLVEMNFLFSTLNISSIYFYFLLYLETLRYKNESWEFTFLFVKCEAMFCYVGLEEVAYKACILQ